MKTIKMLPLLLLVVTAITFTSCEKAEVAPSGQPEEEIFERAITLQDEAGQNAAKVIFKAHNQELLDQIQVDEFQLIAVYEDEPASTGIHGQEPSHADPSAEPKPEFNPVNVLSIEVEPIQIEEKAVGLALEWKKEADDQSAVQTRTLYPEGYHVAFHTRSWARRVQINNYSYNPLYVAFYYSSCIGGYCTNVGIMGSISNYSGYSYTLYRNGWAWYRNCSKQVGAYVSAGYNSYNYRWTMWSNCSI